jgi:hypothetical protein
VVKAPLIKRKEAEKGVGAYSAGGRDLLRLPVETVAPAVKVANVAGFLAARRSQAPPPSVPRVEEVAAFLANEPILVVLVNAVGLVEEPLVVPEGPIPSVLNQQLGSNIQHILEDLEMVSEDSVGMADENLGHSWQLLDRPPKDPCPPYQKWGLHLELRHQKGLGARLLSRRPLRRRGFECPRSPRAPSKYSLKGLTGPSEGGWPSLEGI